MSKPVIDTSSVERYRHDFELIRNTASQIIRDFELFGIEITFSGNEQTAYDELKLQIVPILSALYKNDYSKFNSLLYRIDVDENKVSEVLRNTVKEEQAEQLSHLILERELIKAIFKKLYKNS